MKTYSVVLVEYAIEELRVYTIDANTPEEAFIEAVKIDNDEYIMFPWKDNGKNSATVIEGKSTSFNI